MSAVAVNTSITFKKSPHYIMISIANVHQTKQLLTVIMQFITMFLMISRSLAGDSRVRHHTLFLYYYLRPTFPFKTLMDAFYSVEIILVLDLIFSTSLFQINMKVN